jgi:hypothetical protein
VHLLDGGHFLSVMAEMGTDTALNSSRFYELSGKSVGSLCPMLFFW